MKNEAEKKQNLELLQRIHTQHLNSAAGDVERLQRYVQDYKSLLSTLTILPTKLSHDALVPLGGAALVPGQLVHTNSVLVLLGESYFVNTSACRARDIATRRLKDCEDKLRRAQEAEALQRRWVEGASLVQREPGYDITEHVTEQECEQQAAQHREMVRRHRQQLREDRGDASGEQQASDAWLRRLEELELEERAQDERAGGDESETDESDGSDSDSDSDDDGEVQADAAADSDEDSEEDLPANLHTFKHVKIESPMPSAERKFQYAADDNLPPPDDDTDAGAAAGATSACASVDASAAVAGAALPVAQATTPTEEEEISDIELVNSQIRGRTLSFTRTILRGGRDSSEDSRDDGQGSGKRPPVARRVSWADQPSMVSDDGDGHIKIKYIATTVTTADGHPVTSDTATTNTAAAATATTSLTTSSSCTAPSQASEIGKQDNVKSCGAAVNIKSPADLVKLTTQRIDSVSSPTTAAGAATAASAAVCEAPSQPNPKSILKKTPSQDLINLPGNKTAVSWLESPESVAIKTVYDHEPVAPPSSATPPHTPPPTAFSYKVVARDPDAGVSDVPGGTPAQEPCAEDAAAAPKRVSKFKAGRLKQ